MDDHRRDGDPSPDITAEAADAFIAGLPQVIAELKEGRRQNRETAEAARRLAKLGRAGLLFVFAVGILGGWILQQQAADIKASTDADRVTLAETRATAFEQCQLVNGNARALNQFLDQVIAAVRSSPALTKDEMAARITAYESIKQQLPVCERP